jgi:hypothetical protein
VRAACLRPRAPSLAPRDSTTHTIQPKLATDDRGSPAVPSHRSGSRAPIHRSESKGGSGRRSRRAMHRSTSRDQSAAESDLLESHGCEAASEKVRGRYGPTCAVHLVGVFKDEHPHLASLPASRRGATPFTDEPRVFTTPRPAERAQHCGTASSTALPRKANRAPTPPRTFFDPLRGARRFEPLRPPADASET